jgi:hypothetical protein
VTKLRGTEAELYARLRELTEGFRQVRRELVNGAQRVLAPKPDKDRRDLRKKPPHARTDNH